MSEYTGHEWQTGDIPAFEAFFRQYERLVFKNAYLLTGTREEADDVLQDVFVSVWKARRTFDPGKGKVTTWLHRITVNKYLEMNRKRRIQTTPLGDIDPPAMETSGDVPVSRQEYEELMEAMKTLDQKHRAVLVLRYFNDLSYEEIAHAVGIPLGTVKSRINSGLKMLRGRYDVGGEGCAGGGEGL